RPANSSGLDAHQLDTTGTLTADIAIKTGDRDGCRFSICEAVGVYGAPKASDSQSLKSLVHLAGGVANRMRAIGAKDVSLAMRPLPAHQSQLHPGEKLPFEP